MIRVHFWPSVLVLSVMAACGGTETPAVDGAPTPDQGAEPTDAAPSRTDSGGGSSSGAGDTLDAAVRDAESDAPIVPDAPGPIQCGVQLPFGAPTPPPLPVYAGTCPALAAYPAYTELMSGGSTRRFLVVKPNPVGPDEKLPVLFSWHWLGGDPEAMIDELGLVAATELQRFVAVVPAPKDSETFRWPFTNALASSGRMNEEYTFFDDMLACVAAALPIDDGCVSSIGVSAGALFTDQLVIGRSERLASFVSLSGGVGGLARSWTSPGHRPPGIVLWGGDDDEYPSQIPIMHFDDLSANLEAGMAADGLGVIECIHNCGHTVPPFDTPASGVRFEGLYDFVLRHPYGLADGVTRYPDGLPTTLPSWCAVGAGHAVPRTGSCP